MNVFTVSNNTRLNVLCQYVTYFLPYPPNESREVEKYGTPKVSKCCP
jgi:hypothetical protein